MKQVELDREEKIKKILVGYDLQKLCEELMVFGCVIDIEKYKIRSEDESK